ncbi:MAG: MFS transporter [Ornithinimicrobium sp.]
MTATDPRTRGPQLFDSTHRASTTGLLALVTMFAFEAVAVSLAMPRIADALEGQRLYPIAVVGLLTAALPGMVIGGIWGDARGPSRPLVLGSLGFVLGLLVSGLATTMPLFVMGRLLQGLGSGLALTAMYVAIGDAFAPELRTRIFSVFAAAWVLPSIMGPFLAGAMVDLFGWRSVFLVVAVVASISTGFVRIAMVPHLSTRRTPIRWGRHPAYALAVAVAAVVLHLGGQASGWWAGLLPLAALGILVLALPPLLPPATMSAGRGLPAVIAARGIFAAVFASVEIFLPLVLQHESGLSPTASGLVLMVGALGWTAGSWFAGRYASPTNAGVVLRAAAVWLLGGAVVILVLVPVDHLTWAAVLVATIGFTVMAVGMGLATPLLSTLALDLAPEGRHGESGAAIQVSDALGQSIAAGLIGAVFARWYVWDQGTSYLSGFGLAAFLALLALIIVGRATESGGRAGKAVDPGDLRSAA